MQLDTADEIEISTLGSYLLLYSKTYTDIGASSYVKVGAVERIQLFSSSEDIILCACASLITTPNTADVILAADNDIRKIATGDILSLTSAGGICLSNDSAVASPYSLWNPVSPGDIQIQAVSANAVANRVYLKATRTVAATAADILIESDEEITINATGVLDLDAGTVTLDVGAGGITVVSGAKIDLSTSAGNIELTADADVNILGTRVYARGTTNVRLSTSAVSPGAGMGDYVYVQADDKIALVGGDDIHLMTAVATAGIRLSTLASDSMTDPAAIPAGGIDLLAQQGVTVSSALAGLDLTAFTALEATAASMVLLATGGSIAIDAEDEASMRSDAKWVGIAAGRTPAPNNGDVELIATESLRAHADDDVIIQANSPIHAASGTGGILLDTEGQVITDETTALPGTYANRVTVCSEEGLHSRVGQDETGVDPKLIKLAIPIMAASTFGAVSIGSAANGFLTAGPTGVSVWALDRLPFDIELVMVYLQLRGSASGVSFTAALYQKQVDTGGDPNPSVVISASGSSTVSTASATFALRAAGTLASLGATYPPSDIYVGTSTNWFSMASRFSRSAGSGDVKWKEHDYMLFISNDDPSNDLYIHDAVVVYKAMASYP